MACPRAPAAVLAAGLSLWCIGAVQAGPVRGLPLAEAALALASPGHERLLVLFPGGVVLYRWTADRLEPLDHAPLPLSGRRVRRPGGLLFAPSGESSVWAMTSLSRGAALFAVEDDRLVFRQEADALPWPGSRAGVRFRPDTNLLEGSIEGLGGGPFLALARTSGGAVAVAADGRLRSGNPSGTRVGSAIAPLWPGLLAVSSSSSPEAPDAVLVIDVEGGGTPLATIPQPASIRALQAAVRGERARVAVALETADGEGRLASLEFERPRP